MGDVADDLFDIVQKQEIDYHNHKNNNKMSLIKKSTELTVQSKIKALIYGQAGMGKSTLAVSSPKPLLFDFDNGVHRINYAHLEGVDTVQIQSYQNFLDVLNNEDLTPYETFVIDTGGKALDFMAEYIIKRNPKMGKANGSLTLQGYGERKAEFSQLVKRISAMNKHIIFVAHRDTKTEGDDTRYIPQFGGSNYDGLVTELDLVGYMEANGRERTITFDPTSRNDGKNSCNLPPVIKIPVKVDENGNAIGQNDFFSKTVVDAYEKRLSDRKVQVDAYNNLLGTLKTDIDAVIDGPTATKFVAGIDKYAHIGNSKLVAGKQFATKVKELGLVLNDKKEYVSPETKPTEDGTAA